MMFLKQLLPKLLGSNYFKWGGLIISIVLTLLVLSHRQYEEMKIDIPATREAEGAIITRQSATEERIRAYEKRTTRLATSDEDGPISDSTRAVLDGLREYEAQYIH